MGRAVLLNTNLIYDKHDRSIVQDVDETIGEIIIRKFIIGKGRSCAISLRVQSMLLFFRVCRPSIIFFVLHGFIKANECKSHDVPLMNNPHRRPHLEDPMVHARLPSYQEQHIRWSAWR